jgi:apolipoprotein N-acyltransferase
VIFFAWTPLLLLSHKVQKASQFFGWCFINMLIWNTGTTWWMWNSTDVGTIAAIMFNSMLMTLPWWAYFKMKHYSKLINYIILISCWMCFEYIHHNWELCWPWLSLGNAFAQHPDWIQWYEYTGVQGGTLWILLVNILVYEAFQATPKRKFSSRPALAAIVIIVLPLLLSRIIQPTVSTSHGKDNMVIVQPNIDPYGKFNAGSAATQIALLVNISKQQIDSNTRILLWPETAMSSVEWQDELAYSTAYQPVFALLEAHPKLTLVSGIETYKNYGSNKATATARTNGNGNYYDAFNAAVSLHHGSPFQFYNKSKLVPGVESLPSFLNFMAPVFEQFGGSSGGYGRSDEAAVFPITGTDYKVAPVICYESVFGEYVGSYVRKGANILAIMTNDGWWGNTPGHRQHLQYARLRAIETRKWIARSANTGISAVIDPNGNIQASEPWNKMAAIKYSIHTANAETWYVRYGDYLYQLACLLSITTILFHVILLIRKKKAHATKN